MRVKEPPQEKRRVEAKRKPHSSAVKRAVPASRKPLSGAEKAPKLSSEILSKLSQMNSDKERNALLRSHLLLNAEVVLELNAATLKELRADTKNALALAEAAIFVASTMHKNALLAQCYRVKANVLAASGANQAAIELYGQALRLFEKAKDDEGIARTLTAIIQPHIMLGAYDQAFKEADRARALFLKLGDFRRLARLENNIGNIYHRQDRFEEALAHYERAYQDLLPHGDGEELTISLNNMSMCLINMNDFARASWTYARAKELLRDRADLPMFRLITDYNIAYLHYLRGDYQRAIAMLKSARVEAENIGFKQLVALCYLDLSDIYVELNLSTEAQEAAEEGYVLFQELQLGYEAAKTLVNRAIVLGQEGKMRRALDLFGQAKPLFVKEKNSVWPWLIDLYEAVVLFHEGRYYEARRLAVGAASFFDASPLKSKAVLCHFMLAQIAIRTEETAEAQVECLRALDLLKTVDAPILRFQGHFLLGQIHHAHRDLRNAYAEYQLARAELESLRGTLSRNEMKISFMKNKTELYERLVELCLDEEFTGGSRQEAYAYMELAKSRSFSEMFFQRPHALLETKSGQSELVNKIRDLREELNWYQHRIELEQLRPERHSPEKIQQLHSAAQVREKALLTALGELSDTDFRSAALPSQSDISLEQIQSRLGQDASLLEYFFAGETILAAILTKDTLEIVPVSTVPRVSEALRMLRFQLGKVASLPGPAAGSSESMYRATVAHLADLYNELIAPVREHLKTRHLVIVPHGVLHYLPFQALYDGEEFLIDSHTVSCAPSGTLYALCHLAQGPSGKGMLILGVPDAYAPLIRNEVEAVHGIFPDSELFLGDSASHDLFSRRAPASRFIHVATHGTFRPDNPMFSGIRLSDSYLHLYELYRMRLSAELLTLSGCATGLNTIAAGDELLGLMQGLLYAGAKSLLLSLWDVHDGSSAEFMTGFYGHLAQSSNIAEALTAAAKQVRERYPHPYYWAPFVLVGKGLS